MPPVTAGSLFFTFASNMPDTGIPVWLDFIKTVGFPVAVAGWFMIRMESKMEKLYAALVELTRAVERSGKG